jgi:hypothetical protein
MPLIDPKRLVSGRLNSVFDGGCLHGCLYGNVQIVN